ncbi:glycosyltransferase family 2 protein, partial [Brevibacterium paucivorans]|uniref:glycosyltransferase family 2 protein n=1 Tax=Brevibacterium paucivorans TaxID=170994 RepID=UPI0035711FD0
NGWDPVGLPEEIRSHMLPENVGIPAGRNAGVPLVKGEFLFFLDDDAWLPDQDTRFMDRRPRIGFLNQLKNHGVAGP